MSEKSNEDISIDFGAMEELKDRYSILAENMERLIFDMKTTGRYKDASMEMFRMVHTIKALSNYLQLESVYKMMVVLEDVLNILWHKNPPIRQEIIDWLLLLSDQICEWQEHIESHEYQHIEPVDAYTLTMVRTAVTITKNGEEILMERKILVVDGEKDRGEVMAKMLQSKAKKADYVGEGKLTLSAMQKCMPDIIVCAHAFKDIKSVELLRKIKEKYPDLPVLVVSNRPLSVDARNIFRKLGIEQFLPEPTKDDNLVRKLSVIAKAYYENKNIKLMKTPLLSRIEDLEPLPETVKQIQKLRSDPNTTIKQISDIITKDATLSAKILKIVNSPTFGLRGEINSAHHAVTLLGKEVVIAVALQASAGSMFEINLKPYNLNLDTFYKISYLRMNLMANWYKKVSLSDAATMATAALLGNLGQIAIAEDIIEKELAEEFCKLIINTGNPMLAELEMLHTTAEDSTADILTHWGLDDELVNAIRYSYDLGNASGEIKTKALACFVVFRTISAIAPVINEDVVPEMVDLLEEMNMDSKLYLSAINKIKSR